MIVKEEELSEDEKREICQKDWTGHIQPWNLSQAVQVWWVVQAEKVLL